MKTMLPEGPVQLEQGCCVGGTGTGWTCLLRGGHLVAHFKEGGRHSVHKVGALPRQVLHGIGQLDHLQPCPKQQVGETLAARTAYGSMQMQVITSMPNGSLRYQREWLEAACRWKRLQANQQGMPPTLWQWMSHIRQLAIRTMRAATGPPAVPFPPLHT